MPGELAQAAAEGRSDVGLGEAGMLYAARFVSLISEARRAVRPPLRASAAARWKRRPGSRRTPAKRWTWGRWRAGSASAGSTSCACSPRCSVSPRISTWSAHGCAAPRACSPTMTARSPMWRSRPASATFRERPLPRGGAAATALGSRGPGAPRRRNHGRAARNGRTARQVNPTRPRPPALQAVSLLQGFPAAPRPGAPFPARVC